MKRVLKVRYVDFWPGFNPVVMPWYRMLSEFYDIEESENPDYLFDGGLGYHHLKYDCIKILRNSENTVPDFNCFDYAVSSDFLDFGDRYIRVPSFVFYGSYNALFNRIMPDDKSLLNRSFCSFVVSNPVGDPMRERFFKRLSEYKKVDSGGRWMNNVGGPVKNKLEFLRGYKFNIAFENSSSPGYTTEKIMEAYAANTIPIYYGNPLISADFCPESMILIRSEADIEMAVEEIIKLDTDDEAYLTRCRSQCLVHGDPEYYNKKTLEFLRHIFEQPLDKARRLNRFGYQATQRRNTKPAMLLHQYARDSFWFLYELAHGKIRRIRT